MPTIAQLQAEPWWGREIVTPELSWLGAELCRRTGRSRSAWGDKGNERHLSGGHRSQEWIRNSDYCTNTSYTVQSELSAEQLRHIAAFDWTPGEWGSAANRTLMVTHTKALFAEARAGRLVGMRQIFGTINGTSAIGLNVLTNTLTYPDASHLEHIHGTFDRRYLRDITLMRRIADIITGDDMANGLEHSAAWIAQRISEMARIDIPADASIGYGGYSAPNKLAEAINKLLAASAADETRDAAVLTAVQALANAGGIDAAPIVAAIKAEANATRDLVEQRHAAEMSELSRIHAAQLVEKEAELAGLRAELDELAAAG